VANKHATRIVKKLQNGFLHPDSDFDADIIGLSILADRLPMALTAA